MDRMNDMRQFYKLLAELESKPGSKRLLADCDGRMAWPRRGIYFFFEPGEIRTHSGHGPRVVRVGTHALKSSSRTTLWKRLSQHRGVRRSGGGNHRRSIFRYHVGTALINRDRWPQDVAGTWGLSASKIAAVHFTELALEQAVSQHICQMPFLWLAVDDDPGPNSSRGKIERNAIALLSNYHAQDDALDPPSSSWLGLHAGRELIRQSGLWNVNHVKEAYDPSFLELLDKFVRCDG